MTHVGQRIKARRIELGLSQDDLVRQAGISKGFLSEVENGKRSIGADKLLDVARVLKLSLDYLMSGASVPPPKQVQFPASLVSFAQKEGLSFRTTQLLLDLQERILAERPSHRKVSLESLDWRAFYEAVKTFLWYVETNKLLAEIGVPLDVNEVVSNPV